MSLYAFYEQYFPFWKALKEEDKNYKVQYLPIGMCLGLSIGAALGNISMGICIGLAIGAGIDFLHNKKNDDSKSNDEHEE